MQNMYYIGLDVHTWKISYLRERRRRQDLRRGITFSTRVDLHCRMKTLPQPWTVAMEATMFAGWIYDHLKPHVAALKVVHPLMLRAIAKAKKSDCID